MYLDACAMCILQRPRQPPTLELPAAACQYIPEQTSRCKADCNRTELLMTRLSPGTLEVPQAGYKTILLGGSWLVTRAISRMTLVITHNRGRIAPLITTHEPPSTLHSSVPGTRRGPTSTGTQSFASNTWHRPQRRTQAKIRIGISHINPLIVKPNKVGVSL